MQWRVPSVAVAAAHAMFNNTSEVSTDAHRTQFARNETTTLPRSGNNEVLVLASCSAAIQTLSSCAMLPDSPHDATFLTAGSTVTVLLDNFSAPIRSHTLHTFETSEEQ